MGLLTLGELLGMGQVATTTSTTSTTSTGGGLARQATQARPPYMIYGPPAPQRFLTSQARPQAQPQPAQSAQFRIYGPPAPQRFLTTTRPTTRPTIPYGYTGPRLIPPIWVRVRPAPRPGHDRRPTLRHDIYARGPSGRGHDVNAGPIGWFYSVTPPKHRRRYDITAGSWPPTWPRRARRRVGMAVPPPGFYRRRMVRRSPSGPAPRQIYYSTVM